ncbi:MAG TPA: GTPase HflX [Sediminispirochaeta sp.]|nr:GTPase HflX [Sediminispirochaeta sp.]
MKNMYETEKATETAILVSLSSRETSPTQAELFLDELASLCTTLGIEVAERIVVPVVQMNPKYLLGSGKAQEISDLAERSNADYIVFDDTISPSQQRNLERLSGRCVIDRQEIILEIFSEHARTREAILQVGLARMEYSLPRLTRAWTHLSRQRGGTRGTRGEGETQLEMDRRVVLRKITKLKRELEKLQSQRETRRKQRRGIPIPTGAIVGYTNAGKSSLLNAMTKAEVKVEDQLFATLDPTTRSLRLSGGTKILLTDTVGFIRKLPHNLVDAFHSTLEETAAADFLIHILDASNPEVEQHLHTTWEVLSELEMDETPSIVVFNKIDLCDDPFVLEQLRNQHPEAVFTSLRRGVGVDALAAKIERLLFENSPQVVFRFPLHRFDLVAEVHRSGKVLEEKYLDGYVILEAQVPFKLKNKFTDYLSA